VRSVLFTLAIAGWAAAQTSAPPQAPAESKPAAKGEVTAKASTTVPSYKRLTFRPPPPVKVPEIPSYTLPNGMKVYLLENHELPLVSGFVLVRTGNLFDPKDKIGLAELTGSVMRSGGTKTRTGEQLDEQLESIAASVETSIGETSGRAGFSSLKENIDDVLAIFQDVLMNPEFRQDKLDLAKTQIRSAILRRNDEASSILGRTFAEIVYGNDNPYGWRMEIEHINNIQRQDLIEFYRRYFFPANMILAVQGDFSAPEMRAKLEKLFGSWEYKQPAVPAFPEVREKPSPGVYLAVKEDVTQTNFALGHLGGLLKDPNMPALSVMSDILGGGFSGRMFREVRTRLGLAYSAGGGYGTNYGHPGLFQVRGSTKSASTVDAIQASLKVVESMRSAEVTDQELETAKQSVLNSFVFNFDTPGETLSRVVTYEYYGYPKDFIFQYQKGVQAVTKADVLRVAKEYLHPDEIAIVAVGKPSEFGEPLSALGPVKEVDLTIPQPVPEKPVAAKMNADTLERGAKLLQRVQEAVGGAGKLASIKDFTRSAEVTMSTPQGSMKAEQTSQWTDAGAYRQTQVLPFGKVVAFYDGKTNWIVSPQGSMEMPPPILRQIQGERMRSFFELMLADRRPGLTVNAAGENVLEIASQQGDRVRITLDGSTGLPSQLAYQSMGMQGQTNVVVNSSEWREIDGIQLPHRFVVEQDGKKFAEGTSEWKLNSGLTAEELSKKP
jgi:zinc protease